MIALTAALTARALPESTAPKATPETIAVPKPEPKSAPTTTSTPTTTASETSATSPTIEYAQVAKAITDTFKTDRAKPVAALAKFGAANGRQLKPEDYAAFLVELAS